MKAKTGNFHREKSVEEERGKGELPPLVPHPPQLHLTPEVLQRMIEDASTWAAERAINHFMENRRREPSPLVFLAEAEPGLPPVEPAQGRRKAGERLARPERSDEGAASSRRDNASRIQKTSQQQGSQASPSVEPAQRRRRAEERLARPERREEDATSSRRNNASRTENASQQQGATNDPLPLVVAPARRSPFSMQILAEALPQGMRVPSLTKYDGTGDPEDNLDKFLAKAGLLDMSDAGYCKIFRTTLVGKAMTWFNQLPTHTIENLEQMSQRFLYYFSINKRYPKIALYMFTVVQQE
ncbi:UNVERIFIED_CONTAM: hypothetical protein Slati_2656400 [Sesamum latifolium]|uniref:Retrotransposon gag domain-containing protein n=1 Tax=Sesamum latifolium TaxID=2727402 RepID=A0AAW2VWD1_9LAMI